MRTEEEPSSAASLPVLLWEGTVLPLGGSSVFRVVADAKPSGRLCIVEVQRIDALGVPAWVEVPYHDFHMVVVVLAWALDQIARKTGLLPPTE